MFDKKDSQVNPNALKMYASIISIYTHILKPAKSRIVIWRDLPSQNITDHLFSSILNENNLLRICNFTFWLSVFIFGTSLQSRRGEWQVALVAEKGGRGRTFEFGISWSHPAYHSAYIIERDGTSHGGVPSWVRRSKPLWNESTYLVYNFSEICSNGGTGNAGVGNSHVPLRDLSWHGT